MLLPLPPLRLLSVLLLVLGDLAGVCGTNENASGNETRTCGSDSQLSETEGSETEGSETEGSETEGSETEGSETEGGETR